LEARPSHSSQIDLLHMKRSHRHIQSTIQYVCGTGGNGFGRDHNLWGLGKITRSFGTYCHLVAHLHCIWDGERVVHAAVEHSLHRCSSYNVYHSSVQKRGERSANNAPFPIGSNTVRSERLLVFCTCSCLELRVQEVHDLLVCSWNC